MTDLAISADDFKKNFPEFESCEDVELYILRAECYVSPNNSKLDESKCKLAVYLFAAHLLTLQSSIQDGQIQGGITVSSSIDKVSISMVPPPAKGAFEYWLSQTQYGMELLALVESEISTPFLLGGSFIRTLF